MNLSSSEVIFYSGVAIVVCGVLLGIISTCVWKIKSVLLSAKFDQEYGPREK